MAPRVFALISILLASVAGCSGKTTGSTGCSNNDDCDPGFFCTDGRCLPLCATRQDCLATEVCLDGLCQENTYEDCADIPACLTAQHCVESDGHADAFCEADACSGSGFSTCPDSPNFVCVDSRCADNPYTTCAELPACGIGLRCDESDGARAAACVAIDCTGVGQGSCPDAAFECIAGKCQRNRQPSGMTFAGGVTSATFTSSNYRLDGLLSLPESVPMSGTVLMTSTNYRLEGGLAP